MRGRPHTPQSERIPQMSSSYMDHSTEIVEAQ